MPSPAAHRAAVRGRARAVTAWLAAASIAGVGLFSGLASLRHPSAASTGSGRSSAPSRVSRSSDDDEGGSSTSLSPATTAPSGSTQPAHVSSGGTSHG